MNEVLKDLIRQKSQLEKTRKFLNDAIKNYVTIELINSVPEGLVLKTLLIIGDEQGKCEYSIGIPFEYKGKLEGYFINGDYLNNDIDNFFRYDVAILSIAAPQEMLVFDQRETSATYAQWVPFRDYFEEFEIKLL
jgi:hypothetical protein